jgi:hypothetical protein
MGTASPLIRTTARRLGQRKSLSANDDQAIKKIELFDHIASNFALKMAE